MDEDRHAPNLDDAASGKTDLGMLYYFILPKKKAFYVFIERVRLIYRYEAIQMMAILLRY